MLYILPHVSNITNTEIIKRKMRAIKNDFNKAKRKVSLSGLRCHID